MVAVAGGSRHRSRHRRGSVAGADAAAGSHPRMHSAAAAAADSHPIVVAGILPSSPWEVGRRHTVEQEETQDPWVDRIAERLSQRRMGYHLVARRRVQVRVP